MTTININNKSIESFLYEQAIVNKKSTVDYLTSLIKREMDFLEMQKDIKVLENEIQQVNNKKLKPKPARLLLNEL